MSAMNDILFRVGVAAGEYPPFERQTVEFLYTVDMLVFESHWLYFFITAGIMVVACVEITATFWGFWRLGRTVTMSPVDVGRVFDKRLFEGVVSSNAAVDEIVDVVGGCEECMGCRPGERMRQVGSPRC